MYNAIRQVLDDKNLENKLRKNLKNEIVDTTNEMEKLYEIVENIS